MGNHLISEKEATIRMDFLNTEKANESHKNSYTLEACVTLDRNNEASNCNKDSGIVSGSTTAKAKLLFQELDQQKPEPDPVTRRLNSLKPTKLAHRPANPTKLAHRPASPTYDDLVPAEQHQTTQVNESDEQKLARKRNNDDDKNFDEKEKEVEEEKEEEEDIERIKRYLKRLLTKFTGKKNFTSTTELNLKNCFWGRKFVKEVEDVTGGLHLTLNNHLTVQQVASSMLTYLDVSVNDESRVHAMNAMDQYDGTWEFYDWESYMDIRALDSLRILRLICREQKYQDESTALNNVVWWMVNNYNLSNRQEVEGWLNIQEIRDWDGPIVQLTEEGLQAWLNKVGHGLSVEEALCWQEY